MRRYLNGWFPCQCDADHSTNTAVILPVTYIPLSIDEEAFLLEHQGELICFECGGEVSQEWRRFADHVTGTAVIGRLRDLAAIAEKGAN